MGAADIVPGVSGGTVALVLGIYERLVHNVHTGAEALKALVTGKPNEFVSTLKQVEWVWLLSLLAGVLAAVAVLSSILEDLLHDHPVRISGLFFGLVAGSLTVAWRLIGTKGDAEWAVGLAIAVALFLVLGLRSDTEVAEGTAEVVTQSTWVFFFAGALAICAMILPGISGSFILVLIGMYTEVLGAVNDRDALVLGAFALGCVVGLAFFSSILDWSLEHHHDLVMAAMAGLMLGSLRVLWPWPNGTQTTDLARPGDDVVWPIILAVAGAALVVIVERVAAHQHDAD
jgi:putative membrane protein